MKTQLYITIATAGILLAVASCGGKIDRGHSYGIYIAGDTGKTLQISYLALEKVKNTRGDMGIDGTTPEYIDGSKNAVFTEQVTLPCFKEIICTQADVPFLEILSDNKDNTTKGAIFDHSITLADNRCPVIYAFYSLHDYSDCAYCAYLPKDSILNYFRNSNYPCYIEFSAGDERKKVLLQDAYNWKNSLKSEAKADISYRVTR
jgi:hypothetical protein